MSYIRFGKVIAEALHATGVLQDKTFVDVGCESGVVLKTLKDKGVTVKGIETFEHLVKSCLDKGLEVVHANAAQENAEIPPGDVYLINVVDPVWVSDVLRKIPVGKQVVFGQFPKGSQMAKFVEAQVKLRPSKTTRKILELPEGLEVLTIIQR